AADTVVANGMHAALLIGPRHDIGSRAGEWLDTLASFDVELYCDRQLMDRGHPSNVLGGPLSLVRHLTDLLSRDPDNPPLAAGEIVATGTLTRALPVKAGETWTTRFSGVKRDRGAVPCEGRRRAPGHPETKERCFGLALLRRFASM